jgi:anti-anti-sigma factor
MDINKTHYKRCDVIIVSGRIDSATAPRLSEILNESVIGGMTNLVLDLANVDYASSAGLRVMIDYQKICKQNTQGELVLVSVPKRVFETLELAGFVPLFKFFDNQTSAVGYF